MIENGIYKSPLQEIKTQHQHEIMATHFAQDITEFTNLVLESPTVTAVGSKASALAFASSPRKASASFLAARTSSCEPSYHSASQVTLLQ
jgi:hypothetical protein